MIYACLVYKILYPIILGKKNQEHKGEEGGASREGKNDRICVLARLIFTFSVT